MKKLLIIAAMFIGFGASSALFLSTSASASQSTSGGSSSSSGGSHSSSGGSNSSSSGSSSTSSGSNSGSGDCTSASSCVSQGVTKVGGSGTTKDFNGIVKIIVNVLLFLIGIVSVVMIIFGGFRFVSSNGDPAQAKAARSTILYAVVGLILAIAAYAIVDFVIKRF